MFIFAAVNPLALELGVLARLGDNAFSILIAELDGQERASVVAQRLLAAAAQPLAVDAQTVALSASIGMAMFPGDAQVIVNGTRCAAGYREETGLIAPLTDWVLGAACQSLRRWSDLGLPALPLSVNLTCVEPCRCRSARQFDAALSPAPFEPDARTDRDHGAARCGHGDQSAGLAEPSEALVDGRAEDRPGLHHRRGARRTRSRSGGSRHQAGH